LIFGAFPLARVTRTAIETEKKKKKKNEIKQKKTDRKSTSR
jgi:hypothetical protein